MMAVAMPFHPWNIFPSDFTFHIFQIPPLSGNVMGLLAQAILGIRQ